MREWWDIDFCSKFCLHAGIRSSYDGWYIFRDPNKFVLQKQFYVGSNNLFRDNPGLYLRCIYESLQAELPFPSLNFIIESRMKYFPDDSHPKLLKYY